MGLFDIIAEAKIIDWQKTKDTPKSSKSKSKSKQPLQLGRKHEDYLLENIKELLERAADAVNDQKRNELEKHARNLEVQLISSYEKHGYHLLAKMKQDQIVEFKCSLIKP